MINNEERLKTMLYNAILSWYDNDLMEYNGLDDEVFIAKVCDLVEMEESEYRDLMLNIDIEN